MNRIKPYLKVFAVFIFFFMTALPAYVENITFVTSGSALSPGINTSGASTGDLLIVYTTGSASAPAGWTKIGGDIDIGYGYLNRAFYRIRQPGDSSTVVFNGAAATIFHVYRNVDQSNPVVSFSHDLQSGQAPHLASLTAGNSGDAAVYFYMGLYYWNPLPAPGYTVRHSCSQSDTGSGDKLNLVQGEVVGGNLFIAGSDCSSASTGPFEEGILHIILRSGSSYDVIPPVRSTGAPTGTLPAGTTQVTLSLTTDEPAICRYADRPGTDYSQMPNTFATTGGTNHKTIVYSLGDGQTYSECIRCMDQANNANTDDYTITFSIEETPDTTPPAQVTGLTATPVSANRIDLAWNPSTDNVGVAGYHIMRDGNIIASVPPVVQTSGSPVEFVEYAYASTFNTYGYYSLSQAQAGDLMLLYLTNMTDFTMPAGWTRIGETIILYNWNTYPAKAFYRIRQAGDPMTYTIAQSTGFMAVYRNVDPVNPVDSFYHQMSEEQTPAIGTLSAPADGAADAYFFLGLYHSDILAPPGYNERHGCQGYAGSSEDTGFGDRLNLTSGELTGGRIFVAYPDCVSPGEPPYREGIFHVMLNPVVSSTGNGFLIYQDTTVTPGITYQYCIVAYDAAGNTSLPSDTVSAATIAAPSPPGAAVRDNNKRSL